MKCIIVEAGGRLLYIERDKVEIILRQPVIWKVPEANKNILGVLVYQNQLIAVYRLGKEEDFPCGILIRTKGEELIGITAQKTEGIEEMKTESLEALMPGVWVKKLD